MARLFSSAGYWRDHYIQLFCFVLCFNMITSLYKAYETCVAIMFTYIYSARQCEGRRRSRRYKIWVSLSHLTIWINVTMFFFLTCRLGWFQKKSTERLSIIARQQLTEEPVQPDPTEVLRAGGGFVGAPVSYQGAVTTYHYVLLLSSLSLSLSGCQHQRNSTEHNTEYNTILLSERNENLRRKQLGDWSIHG